MIMANPQIQENTNLFLIFLKYIKNHFFIFIFLLKMHKHSFFFFFVNQGIPGFAQANLRPGWQGLLKRPAADEERG
jgi:hypothetical protein